MDYGKDRITNSDIRRDAMKYGAILGIITVILEFIPRLWQPDTATLMEAGSSRVASAMTATLVSFLYFIVKTGICIYLMVVFTKKVAAAYDDVTNSHTFKFGMLLSLFSGLIVVAVALLSLNLLDNVTISEAIRAAVDAQGAGIPADMADSPTDTVTSILPFTMFFVTLLKCFLIGLIASLVISRSVPGRTSNPFEQR